MVEIRRANPLEVDAAVEVLLAARHASVPAIPPLVHSDDEVRGWFREFVVPNQQVWLAHNESGIAGVLVLSPGWIGQLYVTPTQTNRGVGSSLVDHAKIESAGELTLWTFASNTGAQRFYVRHGFVEVARSHGDNEEGAPDIQYRWRS